MLRFLRQISSIALALALASSPARSNPDLPCEQDYFQLTFPSLLSGLENRVVSEIRSLQIRREDLVHYAPLTLREIKLQKLRLRLPKIDVTSADREKMIDPRKIRFMQSNCRNDYSDGIHTVLENALDLKSGKITPARLGAIRVWRDQQGRIWTLDHRRLAAIRLAEVYEPVRVIWVDSSAVRSEKNKFSNREEGNSILLKIGGDWAIEIR